MLDRPGIMKNDNYYCSKLAIAFLFILSSYFIFKEYFSIHDSSESHDINIPFEQFPEPSWRTPQTLETRTVASTGFARFEIHKVITDNGDVVNDWLWTDERSHVNILVLCIYTR